ncbi:MAG: hypothetical protein Q7J57_05370 [Gemmobacter sp.]|nr:hypothetical protein [Gemmobacter sp.]
MTALTRYARLECAGLWRAGPDAQRRDVVVSLGDASLILSDGRSESALSHWSLPAVIRLNPGSMPALFAPDTDAESETLELDDPAMIDAIATVRTVVDARKSRPGRVRAVTLGAMVAAVVGLGALWLPGALVTHTASLVPLSKRAEIGAVALADFERLTGQPCADPAGVQALNMLSQRLFGADPVRLVVLTDGVSGAIHLPGRLIVLDRRLVEDYDTPDVVAGYLLAEILRTEQADPLIDVLRAAGMRATFTLLTTGSLPAGAVDGYAERRLRADPAPVTPDALIDALAAAKVAPGPYARASGLADVGPRPMPDATPLLPDGDWLSLQAICAR